MGVPLRIRKVCLASGFQPRRPYGYVGLHPVPPLSPVSRSGSGWFLTCRNAANAFPQEGNSREGGLNCPALSSYLLQPPQPSTLGTVGCGKWCRGDLLSGTTTTTVAPLVRTEWAADVRFSLCVHGGFSVNTMETSKSLPFSEAPAPDPSSVSQIVDTQFPSCLRDTHGINV